MTTSTTTAASINLDDLLAQEGLAVLTTPPANAADNMQLIAWSRRSTEVNPVPTAERYRAVILPAHTLRVPDGSTTSKYLALLQSAVIEQAEAKFIAWAKDNMLQSTMPAALLSLDAVLSFWATDRVRSQVTSAQITDWLKVSATIKGMPDSNARVWLQKVPTIAAPNYKNNFSKAQAASIVSKIVDADLESPIAAFILGRCNNILQAESVETAL